MTAAPRGLATDVGRVPSAGPELDDAGRRRVAELLAGPVVSLHDHPIRLPDPLTTDSWREHSTGNRDTLGVEGLRRSGLDVVFASALADPSVDRLLEWSARLAPRTAEGVAVVDGWAAAQSFPGTAVLLALEDLDCVGRDLGVIDRLAEAGFRSAGLAYNGGNPLGGGLGQAVDPGLSALGRDAVRLLEERRVVVDLAHAGDRTTIAAAAVATRPVVVSHAGARALWPSPRMKPDDVLRAVADTGGLIGVEAAPGSTRVAGRPGHDLDAVMAHVEHVAGLVGVAHVALGPDTFFGDHAGLYAAAGWRPAPVPGHEDLPLPATVTGMENPGEAPAQAAAWLVAAGWSDADATAVLGGNALRVLEELL
ncbi:dipeptidase [Modestobacter sp. SSW1-42]|uniref:dipeptidase n=1 Tax=Modestobacter sp. SSW1-42 TaxID=596372 RepID=UPI0039883267